MYVNFIITSFLAAAAVAANQKYTIPKSMVEATSADCVMPGEYQIANFTTFGDKSSNTTNTTSFHFLDMDTGISTLCEKNATSKPTTNNPDLSQRFPCDNAIVEFIYQTTGLTLIEQACPGESNFEASGLTKIDLDCTTRANGTTACVSKQDLIPDNFTSLQPRPHGNGSMRRRLF